MLNRGKKKFEAGADSADGGSLRAGRGCARIVAGAIAVAAMFQWGAARCAADSAYLPSAVPQIISSHIDPATEYYSIINRLVGAERFYLNGFFGNRTMIANVEAGHVWNGHETTLNVNSFVSNSPLNATANQYDYHATMVGFSMVGIGPLTPAGYFYYQFGMSPNAHLTSVALATAFNDGGQFDISSSTYVYGFKTVMQDGVAREIFPGFSIISTVDVVNASFGYPDPAGVSGGTMILDALAFNNHQSVCVAVGNHDEGTALVTGPASGFNVIAVGAMGDDTTVPPYISRAPFSNAGPNDFFNPQTGTTITGVRAAVSICAPGSDLILPAYVGSTGSNMNGDLFDLTGISPDDYNRLYFLGVNGTSFASPIVAGGASLLVDVGHALGGGNAIDGRVIKAVLLNSADKPAGWTNNSLNFFGILKTAQGLDWNLGAGSMNLNRAYEQFLFGNIDVPGTGGGTIHTIGWDFARVTAATPNNYFIDTPLTKGDMLTATLTWFIHQHFNTDAIADPDTDEFSEDDLHATYFDQLGLQVWRVVGGQLTTLIADSTSPYNNTGHLHFAIPEDGNYAIRVAWVDVTYNIGSSSPGADDYALAWSVVTIPEPATLSLFLPLLLIRRRRRALS